MAYVPTHPLSVAGTKLLPIHPEHTKNQAVLLGTGVRQVTLLNVALRGACAAFSYLIGWVLLSRTPVRLRLMLPPNLDYPLLIT